jgi:hypothetical protein
MACGVDGLQVKKFLDEAGVSLRVRVIIGALHAAEDEPPAMRDT